jgi:transposase
MGKHAEITIKESLSTLKNLKRKQTSIRKEKRAYALICLKEGKFDTRKQLANYLGIHVRSLEKWVAQYNVHGIEDLLLCKPKRKGSKIITPQIHEGLEKRVHDGSNPFKGYWEAQQWVQQEFGVEVNYHRIREYLIKHFKTKVKRPRKSHIEKDPNGAEAFFKTAQYLQRA